MIKIKILEIKIKIKLNMLKIITNYKSIIKMIMIQSKQ